MEQIAAGNVAQLPKRAPMDELLATLRRLLRRRERLLGFLRALRAVIHFGPWRPAFELAIQTLRPPKQDVTGSSCITSAPKRVEVIQKLRHEGVCVLGQLREPLNGSLQALAKPLPVGEYAFVQNETSVASLVADPLIKRLLREYLRSEPVLLEASIVVHEPRKRATQRRDLNGTFHFDFAGWRSLNVFVYLTDVTSAAAAHIVVRGSHLNRPLRDLVRPLFGDEEINQRFGTRIETIEGPAGTVFLENTECIHKRGPIGARRAMLNLLFASHRGFLSAGRRLGKRCLQRNGPGLEFADDSFATFAQVK